MKKLVMLLIAAVVVAGASAFTSYEIQCNWQTPHDPNNPDYIGPGCPRFVQAPYTRCSVHGGKTYQPIGQ